MTVTYNILMTQKAKSLHGDLSSRLAAAHLAVDPSIKPLSIRTLLHVMTYSMGPYKDTFSIGGGASLEADYRYIRIIIDLPANSKAAEQKQALMQRVVACCEEYEGKKAGETEIEVRVNLIQDDNVMRKGGSVG